MKKIFALVLVLLLAVSVCADAQSRRRRKARKPVIPTVEQVMSRVDSLASVVPLDSMVISPQPASEAAAYIRSLPAGFDRDSLSRAYIDRMAALTEAENVDSLLSVCNTVIVLADSAALPTAYEALAHVFAYMADTESLKDVLAEFDALSHSFPDNPYAEVIAKMTEDYDDVINPVPYIDKIRGYWATYDFKSTGEVDYLPWNILRINSLENYGVYAEKIGNLTPRNSGDLYGLFTTQYLGGTDGHLEMSFGSEKLKVGDSSFAESGFQSTRQFRANMHASIASSKSSTGNKLAATAATELTAGLLDALISLTANTSKHVAALNLTLDQTAPDLMTANAQFFDYWLDVNNSGYTPRPNVDRRINYVRWEATDGISFVDAKGHIYGFGDKEARDRIEAINRQYSCYNPKYLWSVIGSEVASIGMLTGGIIMIAGCNEKDANGNDIYESDGSRKVNNGKLIGGVILALIGSEAAWIAPWLISTHRIGKRNKAYSEFNRENMTRLQRKATLSVSPVVDTDARGNIAFGVGGRFTF